MKFVYAIFLIFIAVCTFCAHENIFSIKEVVDVAMKKKSQEDFNKAYPFFEDKSNDKKGLPLYSKGLNASKIEKSDDNLPFDSLLRKVNNRIKGIWDPPIRMYGDKDFMIIYDNSDKYYDDFFRVIEKKKYTESEKMICVFAAQKLYFDKYLNFSSYCLKMYEKNNINEDVLFFVLFPNRWKTRLRFAEKYNDPRVHTLFKKVLKKSISDRSRIILSRIYSGAAWKEHIANIAKGFPED